MPGAPVDRAPGDSVSVHERSETEKVSPNGRQRRGRPARTPVPEPHLRRRCARCGRSSAAISTSSRASSPPARQVHDRPRGCGAVCRRNTIGVAAVLGTTFTGHSDDIRDQRPADQAARREGDRRPAARRRGERGLRLTIPLPRLRMGLPARAGAIDQRLGPQVRPRLPGHRLARVPGAERPRRGSRLLRELSRQDRCDVHAGCVVRAFAQVTGVAPIAGPHRVLHEGSRTAVIS